MAKPPKSYPDDIREIFEFCPDCETVIVSLGSHRCPNREVTGWKGPEDRARLAAADDRPLDDEVLVPKGRSQNNAWAYHELREDETTRCGADHMAGSNIATRAEAIDDGFYPCGRCELLEDYSRVRADQN